MQRLWLVALALIAWPGCFTAHYSEHAAIPWDRVERIEPGVTTRAEVLDWFGAPLNFSDPGALAEFLQSRGLEADAYARYPFDDVFAYQYNRGEAQGWTVVVYSRMELRIVSDLLLVFFDEQGRVADVGTRRDTPSLD